MHTFVHAKIRTDKVLCRGHYAPKKNKLINVACLGEENPFLRLKPEWWFM